MIKSDRMLNINGVNIDVNEQDLTWLDKVYELHIKHNINRISIRELRKVSEADAFKASEYLYNDYVANAGKIGGLGETFGRQLEHFDADEKNRALGALFEMVEICEEEGRGKTIDVEDVKEVASAWKLDVKKLLSAYTKC